jgi:hypothetical protein
VGPRLLTCRDDHSPIGHAGENTQGGGSVNRLERLTDARICP